QHGLAPPGRAGAARSLRGRDARGAHGAPPFPFHTGYDTYTDAGQNSFIRDRRRGYSYEGIITFRPNEEWEFFISSLQTKNKRRTINRSFLLNSVEARVRMCDKTTEFNTGVTWLSNPKPGNKTNNNRSDLDGLINPLLNKGQIKASFETIYQVWDSRIDTDTDPIGAILLVTQSMWKARSYSTTLNPSLSYGLLNNLQVDVGLDYRLPRSNHFQWDLDNYIGILLLNNFQKQTTLLNSSILKGYAPYLSFTHRIGSQFQWSIANQFDYKKWRANQDSRIYINNILINSLVADAKTIERSFIPGFKFTWITKPKKQGGPLVSDLDGLKQPLLEKKQVRLDFAWAMHKELSWTGEAQSYRRKYYDIGGKVSYGILDILQIYFLTNIRTVYGYSLDLGTNSNKFINPISPTLGMGITYRPKKNFELFFRSSVTLRDPLAPTWEQNLVGGLLKNSIIAAGYKQEAYTNAGLIATTYDDSGYADIVLGVTFLW
ncbi:MAG: hypothetical protein AB1472_02715, partial [Candidatus Omnitrophota bacterium]